MSIDNHSNREKQLTTNINVYICISEEILMAIENIKRQ